MTNDQEILKTLKGLLDEDYPFQILSTIHFDRIEDKARFEESFIFEDRFYIKGVNEIYRIPTVPEVEDKIDKMAYYWQFYRHFSNRKYYYDAYPNLGTDFKPPYSEPKRLLAALEISLKLAEDNPDKFKEVNK